jgi:hypothetical protein
MSEFRRYRVTMRHDGGRIHITTAATSADVAADLVCKYEHAPRSAVLSVREVTGRVYTDDRGVRYVAAWQTAPASFTAPATCGTCHRTWDDGHVTSVTPAPSARCPFEHWHHGGRA